MPAMRHPSATSGKRIAPFRFARHDFSRALRIWRKFSTDSEIFHSILRERGKAANAFWRGMAVATIGSLWLLANKPTLAVTISLIDLSIPAAFVNFGVAALLL